MHTQGVDEALYSSCTHKHKHTHSHTHSLTHIISIPGLSQRGLTGNTLCDAPHHTPGSSAAGRDSFRMDGLQATIRNSIIALKGRRGRNKEKEVSIWKFPLPLIHVPGRHMVIPVQLMVPVVKA